MFIHGNAPQVQHQQLFFSLGTHRGKRQQDPSAVPVLLAKDEDVGSGARRLRPDLHLTRVRGLLHCPQEERTGSWLSLTHDRNQWFSLLP